jgi:hypothetical protein
MTYRVFTTLADAAFSVTGESRVFRRLGDALDWAGALGRETRAVLTIDDETPAKVTVRSPEDAARTTP